MEVGMEVGSGEIILMMHDLRRHAQLGCFASTVWV